jgi:formylglycine-generating enzyme required for sulfatase activity
MSQTASLFRRWPGLTLALASATVLVCTVVLAQPPAGRKIAVLVGVKAYNHGALPDLDYTERDVEDLARLLEPAGYQVSLLTGGARDARLKPTLANIQRELEATLKDVTKRDTVLVALSGHGLQPEGTKESYFCPCDANPKQPATLLPLTGKQGLVEQLADSGVGVKLLLVDACRNDPEGSRGKGVVGDRVESLPRGMAALFSCSPGQRSFETDKAGGGHGVFFHFVLEGLRGKAGKAETGEVTWNQLADYVQENVEAKVPEWINKGMRQVPNEVRNLSGRSPVLLTLKAASTAPEELPQTLVARTVSMEFVLIPAGTFLMGSPDSDRQAAQDEKPQHRVTISKPFYLAKCAVTVEQFTAFVEDQAYQTEAEKDGKGARGFNEDTGDFEQKPEYTWRNPGFRQGKNHPVVNVSWNDAAAFCKWLEKKEGRPFQLPTEAQWEYACRAKSSKIYVVGDDVEDLEGFANIADASAKRKFPKWPTARFDDAYPFTAPVGSFRANAFGLKDMIGNVWQWCQDYYDDQFYQKNQNKDPVNLAKDPRERRVLRGGSWSDDPWNCRAAFRDWMAADCRYDTGFRVAIPPD